MDTNRTWPTMTWTVLLTMTVTTIIGCASVRSLPMRAERYQLEVAIDPAAHQIQGRAIIDLTAVNPASHPPDRPVSVDFQLHPSLRVTNVALAGADIQRHAVRSRGAGSEETAGSQVHTLTLAGPVRSATLFVDYIGNVDAGRHDQPGVHIAEYEFVLADAPWYPRPVHDAATPPEIAEFLLLVDPIGGVVLEAGGDLDPTRTEETGQCAWRSPYGVRQIVLVGGRRELNVAVHRGVTIRVHLNPAHTANAEALIEAVRQFLDRYEPLLGPFPARKLAIVEQNIDHARTFPTLVLLPSSALGQATIDHKRLHRALLRCWWGNAILADPRDGDWCVPLAAYAADYYGSVLDGDLVQARRIRRNLCHTASRQAPRDDLPIGTLGRPGGCSTDFAEAKGTLVFHMLAQQIGQDRFWQVLRRLTGDHIGRYVSFGTLQGTV